MTVCTLSASAYLKTKKGPQSINGSLLVNHIYCKLKSTEFEKTRVSRRQQCRHHNRSSLATCCFCCTVLCHAAFFCRFIILAGCLFFSLATTSATCSFLLFFDHAVATATICAFFWFASSLFGCPAFFTFKYCHHRASIILLNGYIWQNETFVLPDILL